MSFFCDPESADRQRSQPPIADVNRRPYTYTANEHLGYAPLPSHGSPSLIVNPNAGIRSDDL